MKVLIVCHEDLIPPVDAESHRPVDDLLWRTEYYVERTLRRLRHKTKFCGLYDSLKPLKDDIKSFQPDVVFNLLEEFKGEVTLEPMIPAYLRSLKIPFTGSDPEGLYLTRNKLVTRRILQKAGLQVPKQGVYPAIVKAVAEDSSLGISDLSVVRNIAEERKARARLRRRGVAEIFSEQFIEGREVNVTVFWQRPSKVTVFPPREMIFGKKPGPRVATEKVKWSEAYRKRYGIRVRPAKGLSRATLKTLNKTAVRACQALSVNGLARVDFRISSDGVPHILEVNANPDVALWEEVSTAARAHGFSYAEFLNSMLKFAIFRSR